jgi:hypothetical protein
MFAARNMMIATAVRPWWLSGGVSSANCLLAYAPKGSDDLAASLVNLANPGTYNATYVNAPTFATATGWTLDGTDDYLITGLVATNDQSLIVRIASAATDSGAVIGAFETAQVQSHIYPKFTDNKAYFRAGATGTVTDGYTGSMVLAATPAKGYKDGSSVVTLATALTGTTARVHWIGSINQGTAITSALAWAGVVIAAAIYDTTLTDAQIAAITTSMNAL